MFKTGIEPHVEHKVTCMCGKEFCTTCVDRCPRCYGLHIKPQMVKVK